MDIVTLRCVGFESQPPHCHPWPEARLAYIDWKVRDNIAFSTRSGRAKRQRRGT